jgi:bacillithiol system protein YtxJ
MDWHRLTSISEFDNILMQSQLNGSAFVLFKHSSRCMVSTMALRAFESEYTKELPAYFIDLIRYRDVSKHIEKTTGVMHQSPQVITINKGDVVYHDSHSGICGVTAGKL